jgi:hypothetical protein
MNCSIALTVLVENIFCCLMVCIYTEIEQKKAHLFFQKGGRKLISTVHAVRTSTSTAPLPVLGGGFASSGSPDFAFSVCSIQFLEGAASD